MIAPIRNTTSIKAVLFDLDGTLGDTIPLCVAAFKKSIEPLIGRTLSENEIIETFGPSEEGTIMALAPLHYDKGIHDYLYFYNEMHDCCPHPFEGMKDLLNTLKGNGVRLALVTGKGPYSTEITLRRFGLLDLFEVVETGNRYGPRKPQGIIEVLNRFNYIDKTEMIYVGDAPSDIQACREVGLPIASVAWADSADVEKLSAMHPDALFESIDHFSDWMLSSLDKSITKFE